MKSCQASEKLSACLQEHEEAVQKWKKRKHLLDTKDLACDEIECLLALADLCKRYPQEPLPKVLADQIVATLFFENSTRTRSSFELAASALGASVLHLDIGSSSVSKGETLDDTARTIVAMGARAIIVRHKSSGSAYQLAQMLDKSTSVINAGDGWNAHPTQALLDLFTMREARGGLSGKKVAIVGDIVHSRVARSDIWLLQKEGMDVHVAGPPTLVPRDIANFNVSVHDQIQPAIKDCDFIIVLRMQLERQKQGLIPSLGEYKKLFRLDHNRIKNAKQNVVIMHPGPVNRGIEITDELASDERFSVIDRQVTNGVAVRIAALYLTAGA
jgi:aspartate carbamoyltransferase catalytic subunit